MEQIMNYGHPTITLCDKCDGSGIHYVYPELDILRMHPEQTICPRCEGSGRVIIRTETTTIIEPYKR